MTLGLYMCIAAHYDSCIFGVAAINRRRDCVTILVLKRTREFLHTACNRCTHIMCTDYKLDVVSLTLWMHDMH